jgi:hypothetical protein
MRRMEDSACQRTGFMAIRAGGGCVPGETWRSSAAQGPSIDNLCLGAYHAGLDASAYIG